MAERLPFGEIRPQARPIGSFIQAGQPNTASAARPDRFAATEGVTTIYRAGVGSVQGVNQYEQLATALAPFSRDLMDLTSKGIFAYAEGKIEEGYYQELKNQQARATLNLQLQKEEGAAQTAAQIGQLQKVDPVAGQLLKDANPWKQVGIDRARAQLAGAEIDNVLASDVSQNAGYLATLTPGSTELMQRKAKLTQGVLDKYGLTGDEAEVQFYVTPKLNQAWDSYTAQHNKLRSSAVYQQTVLDTSALGVNGIQSAVQNGFQMPDGSVLKAGTPEWLAEGHRRMTALLDGQLRLLAPDDKAKAMEELRQNFMAFSGMPFVWDLITGIRVGDASAPYEKRPTWGASQAAELLEDRQKATANRLQEFNNNQSLMLQQAKAAWAQGPGGMAEGPEQTAAALKFREEWFGRGFLGVDEFIVGQTKQREELRAALFPADPRDAEAFSTGIKALPANVWTDDPNALANAQKRAWEIASREPTKAARNQRYAELSREIEKAREQATKSAKDVIPGSKAATLEDLDSPEVRAIRKKQKGGSGGLAASVFQAAASGSSVSQAVAGSGDSKLTAAANQLERLYQAAMQNKINEWQASHPNQVLSPEARQNLIAQAKQEVRKSDQYATIMTPLLGRPPAGTGRAVAASVLDSGRYPANSRGESFGQASSMPPTGVSLQNLQNLSDSTVKGYAVRPVLDGRAMRSELIRVGRGDPPSPQMVDLARRAGVNPYRYLQEQLKFYPQMDDEEGSLRLMLQEKAKSQRVGQSISSANPPATMGFGMVPVGYNPLATGSWLMNMLMPPAAAATLPPSYSRYGGGGRVTSVVGDRGGLAATVSAGEGGWNSVNYGTTGSASSMPLTSMTIGQVEAMQARGKVFAVGAYQFTPGVLARARRDAGLSPSEPMSPENQTKLFWGLAMGGKRPALAAYLRGQSNDINAAHRDLSMEWAGVAGPNGRGYYDGDSAGNRASVGAARVRQALMAARRQLSGG